MATLFYQDCLICGQAIDSGMVDTDRRWQASFQAFQLRKVWDERNSEFITPEKGRLVRPSSSPISIPPDGRFVHSACWKIVRKVVGTRKFEQAWLDKLYQCLDALGPITIGPEITHVPTCKGESLYKPAPSSSQYPSEASTDAIPYTGRYQTRDVFSRFKIPPEIVQQIYSFLLTYKDIMNLQSVTSQGASSWVWLSLGRKFIAGHSNLAKTERQHLSVLVHNAIKNTALFPESYPRAVNYTRIWDAVEDILFRMETPPAGQEVSSQGFLSTTLACSLGPFTHMKEISVSLFVSEFVVNFKDFNEGVYLCGIGCGAKRLGYPGEYAYKIEGGTLYGLHLALMDGLIISARAKFDHGWTEWTPELPGGQSQYLVIDPSEPIRGIQATFNTFRVVNIRYTTSSHYEMLDPFPCQTEIPSADLLPPICLVDRIPNDYDAINFIFTYDMARVTAISACVVVETRTIFALELIYDNRPIVIGQHNMHNDWTSVKLTLHLASEMDEVLSGIECAEALLNNGVSIKFLTTLGRSVLFGDDTPEDWTYAPLKSGFFCVAPRSGYMLGDHYPISRVGIFAGRGLIEPLDNFVQPITWPTIDASCAHEETAAFVSSASLKSVTWIIMYHYIMTGYITGMQLIYEKQPPIMLGMMTDECVSLAIRDPITKIELNIQRTTCLFIYQITGITFISDTRRTGTGCWDECYRDRIESVTLDVPENEIDPPLYWVFQRGGASCLSFSLDDFQSDHPPGTHII